MNGALKALSICFKSLMSKVKQVVEEKTNTTAPVQKGFKSLMSKVKHLDTVTAILGVEPALGFKSLMSKVKQRRWIFQKSKA